MQEMPHFARFTDQLFPRLNGPTSTADHSGSDFFGLKILIPAENHIRLIQVLRPAHLV